VSVSWDFVRGRSLLLCVCCCSHYPAGRPSLAFGALLGLSDRFLTRYAQCAPVMCNLGPETAVVAVMRAHSWWCASRLTADLSRCVHGSLRSRWSACARARPLLDTWSGYCYAMALPSALPTPLVLPLPCANVLSPSLVRSASHIAFSLSSFAWRLHSAAARSPR